MFCTVLVTCSLNLFFIFRRKKIKIAACETWPGNCIPTFRKGSSEMQQLESLVESLVQSSSCEYFGKRAIRSHILDTLAERRRQVRKGHDYGKVCIEGEYFNELNSPALFIPLLEEWTACKQGT